MLRKSMILFLAAGAVQAVFGNAVIAQTGQLVSVQTNGDEVVQPAPLPQVDSSSPETTAPPITTYYESESMSGWGMFKESLGARGIQYKGDATSYYQGVASGGLEQHFRYGMHTDHVVNFDTH